MGKFREAAIAATSLSEIMAGRDKMTTKEVAEKYPQGVTIIDFDIIHTTKQVKNEEGYIVEVPDAYPVFAIKEDENVFFSGGAVLNAIVKEWLAMYEGDMEQCRADLIADGGVAVLLEPGTPGKNGREYTNVVII